MGTYKKGNVYWFKKIFKGRKVEESLHVRRKEDAEKKYADILPKIVDGSYFEKPLEPPKMKYVIERYMKEVSPQQKSYKRNQEIASHLLDFVQDKLLSEVTSDLLSSYKANRLNGEIRYGRGKGKLAGKSCVKKELSFLRQVFNKAIDEWGESWGRYFTTNQINPVRKVLKGLKDVKRVRYVTAEEAGKLSASLSVSKLRYLKDMVIVGCSSGLRESRIVNLLVSQCDFHSDRINIPGDEMKNEEPFSIRMTSDVKAILQKVLEERKESSPYVFVDGGGRPFSREAVSTAFRRACKRAGVQDLRFHDLRHDFATVLINNGASLYQVQHALGHKDQRMSARYAHLLPENRDVAKFIEGKGTATILRQSEQKEKGPLS